MASFPQPSKSTKPSFKEQMMQARADAIIQSVNRLLAEKGFDAMTVDEVAADVGIAKASLYKHFPSKEDLAAAAMVSAMQSVLELLDGMPADDEPLQKLKAVVRWSLQTKLAGRMPALPSQNTSLQAVLMGNKDYMDKLMQVSARLTAWITQAQTQGALNPKLPSIAILYTLFARACDPVLDFLRMTTMMDENTIIELVMSTCFDGLCKR